MKISGEHGQIAKRLQKSWQQRLQSNPAAKTKSLQKKGVSKSYLGHLKHPLIYRILVWCLALIPSPACWMIALLLSTFGSLSRASHWTSRRREESILDLYGANDDSVLNLSHRWLVRIICWSAVDATIYLSIWWLLDRVPGWAVFLGIPCYVLAATIGPFLLAAILPPAFLALASALGYFIVILSIVFLEKNVSPETIQTWIGICGVLTPSGWMILALYDLMAGRFISLWIATPLLIFSAVFVGRMFSGQKRAVLENLRDPTKPEKFIEIEEEAGGVSPPVSIGLSAVEQARADFRQRPLLDFPDGFIAQINWIKRALWTTAVVFVFALITREGFFLPQEFRFLALAAILVGVHVAWFPLLGTSVWFGSSPLSQNRITSAFVLFPVSLRKLLFAQMRRDLRVSFASAPFLIFLSTAALFFVDPSRPWAAFATAFSLTFLILINFPLIWFHLAMGVLSTKPFGMTNVFKGFFLGALVVIFLIEIVTACTFPYLLYTQVEDDVYLFSIFFLVPALINAALALGGVYLAVFAFENLKWDTVKAPSSPQ